MTAPYAETHRPQFHFSARSGWLNDPNGLVFHRGEYHLFFQHNPFGNNWGNMTWGHAVSPDLVHWQQLPNALEPDARGTMFSGSALVDWQGRAGFGKEALVAFYTAAGSGVSPPAPYTQCLAGSSDGGRTWQKDPGNPILAERSPGNRDPKVFWYEPGGHWVMVLYEGPNHDPAAQVISFFTSTDLRHWEFQSHVGGFYECPDLFELDGRWVLLGADGCYLLGDFDGRRFLPRAGKFSSDWGANCYAAQTYSDIPAADGRRILLAWMAGGQYPDMPFNQQMTFPCALTRRGDRLCKWPVRELATLAIATHDDLDHEGELFDLEAEIEPGNATICGFEVRGLAVSYLAGDQALLVGRNVAPLPLTNGRFRLRLLVDRTSVEVFANGGATTLSHCFLPVPERRRLRFFFHGGEARLKYLTMRELHSAWPDVPAAGATAV